jgi:hypothetical protein
MLAWSARGYDQLIRGVYVHLAETQLPDATTNAEALFRTLVDKASQTITVVPRFKVVPLIDGIRGWDNARYPARWYQPKILLRRAFALLLPSVRI